VVTDNKQTVRRVMEEVLGGGHIELIDDLFLPNAEYEGPQPARARGVAGFKQTVAALREAFEGLTIEVDDIVGEGDLVIANAVVRGRHVGEWATIAPTGREIAFRIIHLVKFTDGRVSDYVESSDELGTWIQMGNIPAPLRAYL
jgi:predicted ester cyclase